MKKATQAATTLLAFCLFWESAGATLRVVTTTQNLAALVRAVGGEAVGVEGLARGYQDPHFVDAKPSFIVKLNRAHLLVLVGLQLEVGWLPSLLTTARNGRIQPGSQGFLDASTVVEVKEVQIAASRAEGDVHPGGNPHYLLDPENALRVAEAVAKRLSQLDPQHADAYREGWAAFRRSLLAKEASWQERLKPYAGQRILVYHKSWIYFLDWAGLRRAGTIEPKPGIPPSPSYLGELIKKLEKDPVAAVIAEPYYPAKTAGMVARKLGVPFLVLPSQVGAEEGIESYPQLLETIVERLVAALEPRREG